MVAILQWVLSSCVLSKKIQLLKNLVFGLKAQYIYQWQRPGTTPLVE